MTAREWRSQHQRLELCGYRPHLSPFRTMTTKSCRKVRFASSNVIVVHGSSSPIVANPGAELAGASHDPDRLDFHVDHHTRSDTDVEQP